MLGCLYSSTYSKRVLVYNREAYVPNIRELRAIHKAQLPFYHAIGATDLRIKSNNVATVCYINCQGATRSKSLLIEVESIMTWVEPHVQQLSTVYIRVTCYTMAERLGCNFPLPGKIVVC